MEEIEDIDLLNYIQNLEQNVPGLSGTNQVKQAEDVSLEKALQFIEEQKKKNTTKATQRDIKTLHDWLLAEQFELRTIDTIPPEELNHLMTQFFVFVRKRDGSEYQPSTLTAMLYSFDRYLKDMKYSINNKRINILKDVEFEEARKALQSKRVQLKSLGLGNRPNRSVGIDEAEEQIMWDKGVLGIKSPFSIQFTLFYNITLLMGMRGRDEHRQITFGDITLHANPLSVEYILFSELMSKTRDGATSDDLRPTTPKIFCSCASIGPTRCIVEIYKELVRRRPDDFCGSEHPFYLQYKTDEQISRSGTNIWFKREPIGVSSIGKMLPRACTLAGLPPRGNHGLRATTVQRLRKAKVPDDKIIQITGHKSVCTLAVYDTEKLNQDEHQGMQSILQCKPADSSVNKKSINISTTPDVIDFSTIPVPIHNQVQIPTTNSNSLFQQGHNQMGNSLFAGAMISNCVFNINPVMSKNGSGDN